MKIATHIVNVSGAMWWRATYADDDPRYGARAYGETKEEAIRELLNAFPDDGAATVWNLGWDLT